MKKFYILASLIVLPLVNGWAQSIKTDRPVSIPAMEKLNKSLAISPNLVQKKSLETPNSLKVSQSEINKSGSIQRIQNGLKVNTRNTAVSLDSVVFMRPQGYFLPGFTVDYSYYTYYILFGPAYSAGKWRNLSGGATSYSWTLPDPEGEVDMSVGGATSEIASTDTFPEAYYPFSAYFSNPSLTGTDGTNSLTYSWGGEDSTYIYTGGILNDILGTGACNYDCHKNLYAYYFSEGDYLFGGSSVDSNVVDAVCNYFEKPTHTYVLDSLWINATFCTAPAGTKFNVIIHKVDEENGQLTDTIATATTSIEDVLGPYGNGDVYYSLVFGQFNVYDEELGFDVTQDYLEIDDAIFIELNGFNNVDDIDFSVMAQEFNVSPVNENNAYIFYYEDGERYFGNYTNVTTSLSFNLGIVYSYLFADDSTFNAPANGGSKIFNVETFYNPEVLWTEENLPDWLDLSYNFDDETWDMEVQITADPLPESLSSRYEEITMATYGAKYTFYISQEGDNSSVGTDNISNTEPDNISLIKSNGVINATYPKDYNSLIIYNISGSIIGSYELPSTGTFSFTPGVILDRGVYIFRFSGSNYKSKTVKMIY